MKATLICLLSFLAGLAVASAALGAELQAGPLQLRKTLTVGGLTVPPRRVPSARPPALPGEVAGKLWLNQPELLRKQFILKLPDLAVTEIKTYVQRGTRFVVPTIKNQGPGTFHGGRSWTLTSVRGTLRTTITSGPIPEINAGDIFQPRINLPASTDYSGVRFVVTLDGGDGMRRNDSFALDMTGK